VALCEYNYTTEACANGCSSGACQGDPCEGVTCDQPPDDACQDASTLRTHEPAGTCDLIAGQPVCAYPFTDTDCPYGCENGACLPDPCAGITCDTPPPDECRDAYNLIVYDAQGTCESPGGQAECVYGDTIVPCEFGCVAGQCEPDPQQRLGINIYVDNFCNMTVDPQEVIVPAGDTAILTYNNLSEWYEVDVWLSYGGGYLDLATGDSWADQFEWCTGDSVYTGYADISTACSSHRLLIHCQ
jgi:hypothetical protein